MHSGPVIKKIRDRLGYEYSVKLMSGDPNPYPTTHPTTYPHTHTHTYLPAHPANQGTR